MAKNNWTGILKAVASILIGKWLADQKKKSGGQGASGSSAPKGGSSGSGSGTTSGSKRTKQSGSKPSHTAGKGTTAKPTAKSGASKGSATQQVEGIGADNYPGDYEGEVSPEYSPSLDGEADPGEIVWTWVPYEDDHTQGKDRPVLIVGHDGEWLLGLMLTSKDKENARYGKWLDIGAGPWDSQGRDSEIRLDRVIRINPADMRREGSIMPHAIFNKIVKGIA